MSGGEYEVLWLQGCLEEKAVNMSITTLVVGANTVTRAGLAALLKALPHTDLLLEAGDRDSMLLLHKAHKASIVWLDVSGLEGRHAEYVEALQQLVAAPRVIVFSPYANQEFTLSFFRAGVSAYVLSGAKPEELEKAQAAVLRGERWLSTSLPASWLSLVQSSSHGPMVRKQLTPRQIDVLKRIAQGETTKEIAYALNLSVKTVETHRAQMMARLKISDMASLICYAIRHGLVAL